MRILMIGDVVGRPGRRAVHKFVPVLRSELGLDLVTANGENSAAGFGITQSTASSAGQATALMAIAGGLEEGGRAAQQQQRGGGSGADAALEGGQQ